MITINGLMGVEKYGQDNDNLVDVILDVDVSDEYYYQHNIDFDENPKDAWSVYVTQNDYDRKEKSVWVCLCNEGCEVIGWMYGEEKEKILQYVKENELDKKAGLIF